MIYATSHDVAKAFGKYQDEALAKEAVAVTRYGRPTVVIISYADYERLISGQPFRRREVFRARDMPDEHLAELDQAIEETRARLSSKRDGSDAA
jgi:prevent-host-death family protein